MPITLLKFNNKYLLINSEPTEEFEGKVICQVPFSNDLIYERLVKLISNKYPAKSINENMAVFTNLNEHNVVLKMIDYLSSSITPKPQFSSSSEDNGEYVDSYYADDDISKPLFKSKIKTGIIKDISTTERGVFYILIEHSNKQDWYSIDSSDGEIYEQLKNIVDFDDLKIQKINGKFKIIEKFDKTN